MKKQKWAIHAKKSNFQSISEKFGINPVIARVIRNRDIIGDDEIQNYLHGNLNDLNDPRLLKGCPEAAILLQTKINEKKKIRIIGDYDIDGICSTYLLYKGISRCGGNVDYEIPDRMKDGFGLNQNLIELAIKEKVDTIITCDNGIAAINEIAYAKNHGITVIVTDHHLPLYKEEEGKRIYMLAEADVIVNPNQPDCAYPFKKLCGAAVAWKVITELYRICQISSYEAEKLVEFAGFATVGDVMDLVGENRIMVKAALYRIHNTENIGLKALIRSCGIKQRDIGTFQIGFVLGPCINASGRLDTAKRSLRLLLSESEAEAEKLASELTALNEERKKKTRTAENQAYRLIDSGTYGDDKVMVVYIPDCHESIAGLVAGKIRENYYRPAFVVTKGQESAKGSGRSIDAYHMYDEMVKCEDVFLKYGGHAKAAGFSLEESRIDEMRKRLNENCTLQDSDLTEKIMLDLACPLQYLSEELIEQLALIEPCGTGNPKPSFGELDVLLESAEVIGKNKNVTKMIVVNSAEIRMPALYFGNPSIFRKYLEKKYSVDAVEKLYSGKKSDIKIHIAYYPEINEFRGNRSIQIIIQNYM